MALRLAMTDFINLKNHSSLVNAEYVRQICDPILNKMKMSYFTFVRQFTDRSRICLTTTPEWHAHFCTTKHYLTDKFELPFGSFSNGYFLWKFLRDTTIYQDAYNNFKINHGITLIDSHNTYCDFYHFG